jgi:antitoxin (DNA-binding transcriptional repressor) of toxin-antitoxin stability system
MYRYNLSPLEDVSTDWLRSHLRQVLDEVNFHGARYSVLRRGTPIAGIVPITEARALFEATRVDRAYRDISRDLQRQDEDRLRHAVSEMAGHDNRAESARR